MINVLRFLGAILAGLVLAFVSAVAVEFFSALVYPFPPGFSGTMEEMHQHVARYPHWVLAVVVPAWGFGAFISTWTARRIGARAAATLVGLLLVAAVVFNVAQLPYPLWFEIASVAGIVLAAGAAIGLAGPKP